MRELTGEEIEELAGRPSCNKKAITNFLGALKNQSSPQMWSVITNARAIARDSGWNRETADAIVAGIKLAYGS